MKEIRLVTRYFPFMSRSQQEFLRELFVGAEDFRVYVTNLVDAVCTNKELGNLVPFACRCIWVSGDLTNLTKLVEVFNERATSLPWYIHAMYHFGQFSDRNVAVESIRKSLSSFSENWILFESKILEALILSDIDMNECFRLVSQLEQERKSDSRFEIFAPTIQYVRGNAYDSSDDMENAVRYYREGLELAIRYGDWFIEASSQLMLANVVNDHNQSLKYLEACEKIFHLLANTMFDTTILNNKGFFCVVKGDYDKAIEYYLTSIELTEKEVYRIYNPYLNIAVLYGNIGQPEKALEYSKKALEIARDIDPNTPSTQIEMARALVLSNKFEEAFDYLEAGGELAFKSGSKKELSRYYLVKGMLEMARNNYIPAISSLKRGLRIAETRGAVYYILQILLQLAGAEILAYTQQEDKEPTGPPSLALARLEQLAKEQQLVGLSVQVMILKAEIDLLQNEKARARKRLEEALVTCEKEKLLSLRSKIESRIAEIDTKKSRKSLIERFKSLIRQIAVPSGQTKKTPFVVMGCIMILRDAGLEVYSNYTDPKITSDPSLVAGLISAVSNFTRELREDTTGNLQSIIHQDIAVLLEHGSFVTCALLTNRDTYEARLVERRFLEKFEDRFSDSLKQFQDGTVQPLNAKSIYESVVIQRELGE